MYAGDNVLGANKIWVQFRRCAWHTALRLYFWTGGFFTLFLIQGDIPSVRICPYFNALETSEVMMSPTAKASTEDSFTLCVVKGTTLSMFSVHHL